MDKKIYYIALGGIMAVFVMSSSALANEYDAKANELANSILTQIQNDVPPTIETGGTITAPLVDTTNGLLGNMFVKTDSSFTLTNKSLNERLNGGLIAKDLQEAIDYLYGQKLSKFNTISTFQSDNHLRRDEAAKFFGLFAKQTLFKKEDTSRSCAFSDLAEGHTDLQTNVTSACQLGIFRGKNGYFNPTQSLTNGEALTVLIRIIYGNMDETDKEHWAKNYWQKAQTYGLTQGTVLDSMKYLDTPITRGDMARILEAARFIPTIKLDLGGDISYSLAKQGYVLIQ